MNPKLSRLGINPAPLQPIAAGGFRLGENSTAQTLAANQTASAAFPSIQSVAPVTQSPGVRELKRFVITMTGIQSKELVIAGNYMFVERLRINNDSLGDERYWGPAQSVYFKSDTSNVRNPISNEGQFVRFPSEFSKIQFENDDASAQTVMLIVWLGYGEINLSYVSNPPLYQTASLKNAAAAAYALGDCIDTGYEPITAFAGSEPTLTLRRARLSKLSTTTLNAAFKVYLFNDTVGATNQIDNTPFVLDATNIDYLAAVIDFPAQSTGGGASAASFCEVSGLAIPITKSITFLDENYYGRLHWVLVADAAFTGTGESFKLEISYSVG